MKNASYYFLLAAYLHAELKVNTTQTMQPDKILIIDDKPENLYSLETMLATEGRIIVKALSGQEALKLAFEEDFSLILLDVQMPEMDGFEVAQMLKSTRRTRKIPIVFVTAISKEKKYILQGFEDGAIDYLFKPLDVEVTRAKVDTLLQFFHQQQELEIMNNSLATLNEQKNYFLGMASHDLRNPIGNIITLAQFVDSDAENLSDEQRSFLAAIIDSGQYMLKLLNDLLDISKIESGKMELQLKDIDLAQLVHTIISDNTFTAQKKNITLQYSIPENLPAVSADAGQMRQAMNNLVSNAIKFSMPGTMVEIIIENKDEMIVISIQDHGQGIPSAEIDKLFKPFQKTSVTATAGEKSTGLGLTITKKVIEAHKGSIWVTSEVGKGSIFSFSLPAGVLQSA